MKKILILTFSLFILPLFTFAGVKTDFVVAPPNDTFCPNGNNFNGYPVLTNLDNSYYLYKTTGQAGLGSAYGGFVVAGFVQNDLYGQPIIGISDTQIGVYTLQTGNGSTGNAVYFNCNPPKSGVLFGRTGESQTANQTGGSLLAAVGFVTANSFGGILPYLLLSVGVFVGFYIIEQLVMILGNRSTKKEGFYKGKKRMEDQSLGKNLHDIQEKGITRF